MAVILPQTGEVVGTVQNRFVFKNPVRSDRTGTDRSRPFCRSEQNDQKGKARSAFEPKGLTIPLLLEHLAIQVATTNSQIKDSKVNVTLVNMKGERFHKTFEKDNIELQYLLTEKNSFTNKNNFNTRSYSTVSAELLVGANSTSNHVYLNYLI